MTIDKTVEKSFTSLYQKEASPITSPASMVVKETELTKLLPVLNNSASLCVCVCVGKEIKEQLLQKTLPARKTIKQ